ncbi:MAG: M48 family metalloprotease [Chthonomonadales bacterium]|nr:M48 family metalloprotease [Chthonomonadales bacterium]
MLSLPPYGRARPAARRGAVLAAAFALCAVVLWGAGCKNTNFLSTRQEVNIGRQGAQAIEQQYPVEEGTPAARRVERIGQRLLEHSDRREGVPYSFRVIDKDVVNAVSLPGGPIYVFKGLLDLAGTDEDALAGVIAHELGHIDARHAAKQMSQQMAANLGIQLLLKGRTVQDVASLASDLLGLSYSRDDEYEADSRGLSYAYRAGYDPRGLLRFFEKLEKREGQGDGPEFLGTHPVTQKRVDRAQRIIETQAYRYGH